MSDRRVTAKLPFMPGDLVYSRKYNKCFVLGGTPGNLQKAIRIGNAGILARFGAYDDDLRLV